MSEATAPWFAPLRIISWNVAGLRAAVRKGAIDELLAVHQPDVLCLQEIKADDDQLAPFLLLYPDWVQAYHPAEQKGYSGTGIWVSQGLLQRMSAPVALRGLPGVADAEGRICRVDIDDITILSIYFPNGGKSPAAWEGKLVFYDEFLAEVNRLRAEGRTVLWLGDVNVAHTEIDLARPKENDGRIGFHPRERAWMTRVLEAGWADAWRKDHPDERSYTWWDQKTRARDRDIGWRIDYAFVPAELAARATATHLQGQMGSDHCPVLLEIT